MMVFISQYPREQSDVNNQLLVLVTVRRSTSTRLLFLRISAHGLYQLDGLLKGIVVSLHDAGVYLQIETSVHYLRMAGHLAR